MKHFFSVSKHRIYLVWNQVVGTLSGFFTLSMLLIEGFIGEASNQLYQCGSIVSTATNVLDCYLEDQCLFKLNFVTVDFVGLRSDSPILENYEI